MKLVKENKKIALLFVVGLLMSIIILLIILPLRNQIIENNFETRVGDASGLFNGQRKNQLQALITEYDDDKSNDQALAEDIDLHGQLFYVVLAKIGAELGWWPIKLFYMTQYVAIFLLVLIYPLLLFYAIKSVGVSLLCFGTVIFLSFPYLLAHLNDSYWATPWCILFTIPILLGLWKQEKWGRLEFGILTLLLGIICASNIIRPSSGLGAIASLLIIYIYKFLINKQYNMMAYVVYSSGLYLYSEKLLLSLWNLVFQKNIPNVAAPWHAIWCGLGWKDNPYGFKWNDIVAYEKARSIEPDVILYSDRYFEILKEECFKVLKIDPLFYIKTWGGKLVEALTEIWTSGYSVILSIILCLLIYLIYKTKHFKISEEGVFFVLFGIFNMVAGVAQGVIGEPTTEYILGGYAGQTFIIIGLLIEVINIFKNKYKKDVNAK